MKIINKLKYCTLILLVLASCAEIGDDPAFDTSASERATEEVIEITNTLTSSTEGWVFEYYPSVSKQYGGYNYIVSFDNNKMVDVYSELQNDFSIPETSTYDVIARGGPVLSFDTYNSVMHYFSTPSAALYQARGGDYEFVLSNSDITDVLNAKGTFTGNKLKMVKLTETPQSYLTKVKATVDYLSGVSYFSTIDGENVSVPVVNRNFTFDTAEDEDTVIAFIYTPTGVKLYEPITLNGSEVSEFILDKVAKQLISTDGNTILEIVSPPFDIQQNWTISTFDPDISDSFFNAYVDIYNANVSVWGEALSRDIDFGNTTVNGVISPGIAFLSDGVYYAQYILTFSGVPGEPDQLGVSKVAEGFNWSYYTHLNPLVDFIVDNAPYTAEPTPTVDPTEVKMTSVANPDAWFIIRK